VHPECDREPRQIKETKEYHNPFPAAITTRQYQGGQQDRSGWYTDSRVYAEFPQNQRDRGKFGNQRQKVEEKQICD
jgi:hypothetical protein